MSLTVVCMLWSGEPGDRRTRYSPEHVRALKRMALAHVPANRFVCLTDQDVPGVETVPIHPDALELGKRYPKLALWSEDIVDLGERILYLDLDCVLLASMADLVARPEPVVIWRDPLSRPNRIVYNTSMILMTPGAAPDVWRDFTGLHTKGVGSDQAWVRQVLGPDVPTWGPDDGVVSFKAHCKSGIPDGARAVFFHGRPKPWGLEPGHWARDAWAA